MKGGHAASGPAPDPNALRRNRTNDAGWTDLPAAGREGDPPPWPLPEASAREADLWRTFWAKPQAVQWERLGMDVEVALYVRRLAEAELPGSSVALGTLVKQLAEQLGLTIPGLRMHRWKIVGQSTAAAATPAAKESKATPARAKARDRWRVADGAAS